MSSFTRRLAVAAVTSPKTGWAAMLPPGFQRPSWEVLGGFRYLVSSADAPSEIIRVPAGFVFDGASVPLPFRLLLPMAHPDYIQAAALHDWMLKSGRYTRRYCDAVFHEALGVFGPARTMAGDNVCRCAHRRGALACPQSAWRAQ